MSSTLFLIYRSSRSSFDCVVRSALCTLMFMADSVRDTIREVLSIESVCGNR